MTKPIESLDVNLCDPIRIQGLVRSEYIFCCCRRLLDIYTWIMFLKDKTKAFRGFAK